MPAATLSNGRLSARFGSNPLAIRSLKNLCTGAEFCAHGTHSLIVRTPGKISDPAFLNRVDSASREGGALLLCLVDASAKYRAELRIAEDSDGLRFDATVTAPEPVWMAEWKVSGLDLTNIIIPALGGQSLGAGMPAGTTLTYKYPFWWNAQFVIGAMKGGGCWLRTKETDPRFKLVRIKKGAAGFDLSYGFEADAPLTATTLSATWYLDCYRGTWNVPVETHRSWLEPAFGLHPLARHPHFPPWASEIDFVLELWGIGKDRPEPLHTFADMERRLRSWARLHVPERTLLYLPGFAEHGIDSRAPSYAPSEELGGKAGFQRLVETAHRRGYRVMVHTNAICMTFEHPQFERFRDHQVVDAFGRLQGWGLDIDGDWLSEPYFAYINPGVREWGDLMEGVIGDLIRTYGVDAVFLDQTLLAFNVSRGPNFVSGMREFVRGMQEAFPTTLFAGEGIHEQVLAALPMAQIHGIDSIAEVHGMEGRARWRQAHPVSSHLFSPYTRLTAHLLTRHPSHPMFELQESAYKALGVIPALCLYNALQPMDTPGTRRMIRRAAPLRRK
ncbi:MAG: DUF6259 domain-containing protein [Bacteroidota bacterium]